MACHRASALGDIDREDVIRFDHGGLGPALQRLEDDRFFATAGFCTDQQVHLSGGLLMGRIIGCPKHDGRFDVSSSVAKGAPACIDCRIYPVKVKAGKVLVDVGGRMAWAGGECTGRGAATTPARRR